MFWCRVTLCLRPLKAVSFMHCMLQVQGYLYFSVRAIWCQKHTEAHASTDICRKPCQTSMLLAQDYWLSSPHFSFHVQRWQHDSILLNFYWASTVWVTMWMYPGPGFISTICCPLAFIILNGTMNTYKLEFCTTLLHSWHCSARVRRD